MKERTIKSNKVSHYRKIKKLSQADLAKRVRCNVGTIYKIEKGKRLPGLVLAVRIARVLDADLEDIFYIDD